MKIELEDKKSWNGWANILNTNRICGLCCQQQVS